MTDERDRLEEIRERLEAATDGPWRLWNGWGPDTRGLHYVHCIGPDPCSMDGAVFTSADEIEEIKGRKEDFKALAHAPTDLQYLLERLERVERAARDYMNSGAVNERRRLRSALEGGEDG